MYDIRASLEAQVEELAAQVRVLTLRVDELSRRQEAAPQAARSSEPAAPQDLEFGVWPAGLWHQLTGATVLSSVAIACFLLAVALVLRTLVDNHIVNQQMGAYTGLVYACGLIGYGHYRYSAAHRTIPVFMTCGLIMLFSIVIETHNRFELIPIGLAFALLALAVAVVTHFGVRYHVPSVVALGILGALLAGLLLQFPHPVFSYLGLLMLLAAGAAYTTAATPHWRWIPWTVLVTTAGIWLIWTMKGRAVLSNPGLEAHPSTLGWYLPVLGAYVAVYIAMPVWAAVHERWPYRLFERTVPVAVGTGAYLLATGMVRAADGRADLLGHAGVLVGLGCASLAMWLSARDAKGLDAAPAWMLAALMLLAVAAPASLQNMHLVILIQAVAAWGMGYLGHRWGSRLLFGAACVYQVYVCAQAALAARLFAATPDSLIPVVVAALAAGIALAHYSLCRAHHPAADPEPIEDAPAFVMMFLALLYVFAVARPMLYAVLALSPFEVMNSFHCSQSVLINAAALGLAVFAVLRHDRVVLVMAFVIAGIGALKVFAFDMTHCQGLPLVASVSFFGLTAALGSVIWQRWQRSDHEPAT
jgi:hypothetical protein